MVKRRINTIFGVICVVVIIVVVSVVSRQPCPTKDTAGSANADPQATQNKTLPHKQQTNVTISCRVPLQAPAGQNRPTTTATMATQRRHQTLVPLSWSQNQEMAPTTQGVCSKCKTAAGDIASPHHKCIRSTIMVGKAVGGMWERRWRKER